jgi:hypothetical protein
MNPNDDWTPPPPIAEDMEDVQTSWGFLPRWKARALALAEIQTVVNAMTRNDAVTRNDDAACASALSEEQKPPPLAADAEPVKPTIDPDVMKMIEDRIDELTARMNALERRRAAEAALTALEDEIERMYPPREGDDDTGLMN